MTDEYWIRCRGIMPSSRPEDDDLDRAAAVRLRKLDAIDPSELRRLSEAFVDWSSDPGPDELAEASIVLSRIADALGGTE